MDCLLVYTWKCETRWPTKSYLSRSASKVTIRAAPKLWLLWGPWLPPMTLIASVWCCVGGHVVLPDRLSVTFLGKATNCCVTPRSMSGQAGIWEFWVVPRAWTLWSYKFWQRSIAANSFYFDMFSVSPRGYRYMLKCHQEAGLLLFKLCKSSNMKNNDEQTSSSFIVTHLSKTLLRSSDCEKRASLGLVQMFRLTRGCFFYVLIRERRRNSEFEMKRRCLGARLP